MKILLFLAAVALVTGKSAYAVETNDIVIDIDYSQAPDLANFAANVRANLVAWYPWLANVMNSPGWPGVGYIHIYFDPNYDGVAYASGGNIVGAVNYYRGHQDDIGSMIHEMVHVIQGYRSGPGWLVEGIADYWRYYHFEPNRKPGKPGPGNSYRDGYGVTAYFLDFIQNNYGDMLYWLNKDCREGTYNDGIWVKLLGKDVDALWADMMARGK